jgi:hypothetical protein
MVKALRAPLALVAVLAIAAVMASAAASDDGDLDILGNKRTVVAAQVAAKGDHKGVPSAFNCVAIGTPGNTKLDCDDNFPNNEPQIAVDPLNPRHMVASSNDYSSCCDQFYTSFDAGASWITGDISTEKQLKGGRGPIGSDPVTSFDVRHQTVLHASLNFFVSKDFEQTCDGDVVVSPSTDGGITWQPPAIVYQGEGCDLSGKQVFNDKEWIVTDNNPGSKFYGRSYVTWTRFVSKKGEFQEGAIWIATSDDGGFHWKDAREISGSSSTLCSFQTDGKANECDEDQFSVPTIGPDGTVYVAFENSQNAALDERPGEFDDQYLLVKSTDGGKHWSDPGFVAGLEDGADDYPFNADGRQTLTGYQLRVNSAGNVVADPTHNGWLYLVYADNSHGAHDSASPSTNTDVFITRSTNGGQTWSAATPVSTAAGDQWFPWVDVDPTNGSIGVLYNDRGAANGTSYGATLAQGAFGALVPATVSTAPSDPVHALDFQAGVPGCVTCSVFNGEYTGLAYGSDGVANAVWTDMRDIDSESGLHLQFIYAARS